MSLLKAAVLGAVCAAICFTCIVCNMSNKRVTTAQDDAITQIYKY